MMLSDLIDRWNALGERVYRRRWWIRTVAAVVLLPWFGHFAYTRMATMLPLPRGPLWHYQYDIDLPLNKLPPELDRTKDLAAAILALPADPVVSVPSTAPTGMQWVAWQDKHQPEPSPPPAAPLPYFSVTDALEGPWSPSTRLVQGEVVKYLELPATQSAMTTIAELADQPLWSSLTEGQVSLGEVHDLAKLYTTRSRYYMEEKKDFARAVNDLRTVLLLSRNTEEDGGEIRTEYGGIGRTLALDEVILWSREYHFDRNQARMLQELLRATPYDPAELFDRNVESGYKLMRDLIDECYTQYRAGDGWLVLYSVSLDDPSDWPPLISNLLTPLFADRREIVSSLDGWRERIRCIPRQPYARVRMRFVDSPETDDPHVMRGVRPTWFPNHLDDGQFMSDHFRSYMSLLATCASYSAAEMAIALSLYRHEHGCYPRQLSELVPDYLDRLPLDPFSDQPLRYRLEAENGYVLYSVGKNGIDDDGIEPDPNMYQSNDLIFPRKRNNPPADEEYVLIPARTATQPGEHMETDKEKGVQ